MVAGKCVQLLDKADKKVAEQAQKMLVELVKYMGKPCLLFALSKLNENDSKALETKLVRAFSRQNEFRPFPYRLDKESRKGLIF